MIIFKSAHETPLVIFQRGFERLFEAVRAQYQAVLITLVWRRTVFVPVFLAACGLSLLRYRCWGKTSFPTSDNGQFRLHVRAKTGTRIEEMARLCDLVDASIRNQVPTGELNNILDNIGLPYSGSNLSYSNSGQIGSADADLLVSLNEESPPDCRLRSGTPHKAAERISGHYFLLSPRRHCHADFKLWLACAHRHTNCRQ